MQTSESVRLVSLPSRFRLHPCYRPSDLGRGDGGCSVSYVHHFFQDAGKLAASDDFRVDIFYIPTSLEVYAEVKGNLYVGARGSPASHPSVQSSQELLGVCQDGEWVLHQLQTTQEFPGKFTRSKEKFVSLLASLNHYVGGGDDTGDENVLVGDESNASPPAKKQRRTIEKPVEATNPAAIADESLPLNPLLMCRLPGKVIAKIAHPMEAPEKSRDLPPESRRSKNFWLLELSIPVSEEDSTTPEFHDEAISGIRTPELIHRRLEWFAHFYIDAISNIQYDVRWRVFLPVRFMSEEDPLQRVMNETNKFNEAMGNTKPDIRLEELVDKINDEWPQLRATTVEEFCIKLAGTPGEQTFESNVAMDAVIQNPPCPVELLGLVTVFQFFALPRDRARISQFFVLPHRQRAGLGRQIHTCIMELFCADEHIRQINVEDPAPGYQRVRDIASVDLAISNRIITPECLFPAAELRAAEKELIPWNKHPGNPQRWMKYRSWFANMQKETPPQRRRVRLLLRIARLVPSDLLKPEYTEVLTPTTEPGDSSGPAARRTIRPTPDSPEQNPLIGWQRNTIQMTEIRVEEKRRFRLESLDWYSNQRSVADVQVDLEVEWQQFFKSLCSSIRSLRKLFPLKAAIKTETGQAGMPSGFMAAALASLGSEEGPLSAASPTTAQ